MKKTLFVLLTLLAALLVFVSCDESLDADVFNTTPDVEPVDPTDPKSVPLTLDFTGNGNLKIQKEGYWSSTGITMWYSKDGGATTTALEFSGPTATISVSNGESVSLYGTMGVVALSKAESGHLEIKCEDITSFNARGNVMSLVSKDDFANLDSMESTIGFYKLFCNNVFLVSAEDLLLPATTLADQCYMYMFDGCTSLTTAPTLPATTLADRCYGFMFKGCSSLTTAPALPATTLADYCYEYMFSGCTNLTTAPELLAPTLAVGCYLYMFSGCENLTTAPALPATILANGCYMFMFNGCTSLTTAPELPAETLAAYCYHSMFKGCSSLNYITCLATSSFTVTDCTTDWVAGVAATGTFKRAAGTDDAWKAKTGTNGIPSGWTVDPALVP